MWQAVARTHGSYDVRRRLLIIATFLLAGMVVNVAVAWGCAVWLDSGGPIHGSPKRGVTAADDPRWWVWVVDARGSTMVKSWASRDSPRLAALPPDATQDEIDSWLSGEPIRVPNDLVPVPVWSRASGMPTAANYAQGNAALWEDAAGWPMRCLASLHQDVVRPNAGTSWGLRFGASQGLLGLPRVLPLRPIWLGFAVNTVFYAMTLWLLLCGPFGLRRLIRIRRGLCPKCTYPMGKLDVCTECGHVLPNRPGAVA